MMTTMVALLGALPLATCSGAGAALHQPLGITIVGGFPARLGQFYTTRSR